MRTLSSRTLARVSKQYKVYVDGYSDDKWHFQIYYEDPSDNLNIFESDDFNSKESAQRAAQIEIMRRLTDASLPLPGSLKWEELKIRMVAEKGGLVAFPVADERQPWSELFRIAGLLAAIVTLLFSVWWQLMIIRDQPHAISLGGQIKSMEAINSELLQLKQRMTGLTGTLKQTPSNSQIPNSIRLLQSQVTTLQQRISSFEIALGDDPAKHVAILMLRKDLDVLKDQQKSDIATLQGQFADTFSTMRWLITLLGGGIIASIVSAYLSKPKS